MGRNGEVRWPGNAPHTQAPRLPETPVTRRAQVTRHTSRQDLHCLPVPAQPPPVRPVCSTPAVPAHVPARLLGSTARPACSARLPCPPSRPARLGYSAHPAGPRARPDPPARPARPAPARPFRRVRFGAAVDQRFQKGRRGRWEGDARVSRVVTAWCQRRSTSAGSAVGADSSADRVSSVVRASVGSPDCCHGTSSIRIRSASAVSRPARSHTSCPVFACSRCSSSATNVASDLTSPGAGGCETGGWTGRGGTPGAGDGNTGGRCGSRPESGVEGTRPVSGVARSRSVSGTPPCIAPPCTPLPCTPLPGNASPGTGPPCLAPPGAGPRCDVLPGPAVLGAGPLGTAPPATAPPSTAPPSIASAS